MELSKTIDVNLFNIVDLGSKASFNMDDLLSNIE